MQRTIPIAVFFAALAFTLVMAWLPHPPQMPGPQSDKFQHVLAFVTLSVLAGFAFPEAPVARIGKRLSFLGALIEVVQAIPRLHRDCDIADWMADTAAIALTLAIVWAVRRHKATRA